MKKENVLSIILIIYLTGCAVHLVPKGNPEIKISPSGLMVEQESRGIKVSVDGGMSKFTKFDKYTPVFLIIKNNTDKIISLEYGNFTIKDEANNIYKPFSIKEVIGSVEHNKPFQLAKWDGRFIGNNRKVLVNKNNGVFLVKENGWKVVKDDSKGKKRGYVFIYPFYDPFYNPFFDYPFYPYGPYSPYYGRMFYPYDYYYYYGYYNPYRPYTSPYYREDYYTHLPMDILPHREVSGYLYFPQVLKTAKDEIRLSVDIEEAERVMEFSFKINK